MPDRNCMKIALIPAYEPSDMLTGLVTRLYAEGFRVVIIDDGSGKRYRRIFQSVSACSAVLAHPVNRGKGRALKTGLKYIAENYPGDAVIVTLDADGQHLVDDAIRVCASAVSARGCLVLGGRSFDGQVPMRSRFGNAMTRFVYRALTGVRVRDTQTGLRAFGAGLIPLMLRVDGDRYEYEMNVLLECARRKVPIIEVRIRTVYYENNAASHFHALKDSARVYANIVKFAASSVIGFLVDYGMYSLLVLLTRGLGTAVSVPLSNVAARAVSAGVNFAVNKRLVFKNKDSVFKTAAQYFALAVCVLAGNTLLLSFLVENLNVDRFSGKIFTEITFFTFSWFTQRFLIFKDDKGHTGKKF